MINLRIKLVEGVLKLFLQKFCDSFFHGVSQLLCAGDSLYSAHIVELDLAVHELGHALVQLQPMTKMHHQIRHDELIIIITYMYCFFMMETSCGHTS